MPEYISISEILDGKQTGKTVGLHGWAHTVRKQKEIVFIILRDSSGSVQVAVKGDLLKEADKASVECSIELTGEVKADQRAPSGFEVLAKEFKVVGSAERWPITRDKSEEHLRELRHLWIRDPKVAKILKIRSHVFQAIREFYTKKGFYEYQSPMFTKAAVEGGSTLFPVKYGDQKGVYLSQSWQLYAEAGIFSLEKIFTIAPSFRAEKSRTIRHLSEYWHHEMEAAWMGFEELLKMEEELILFVVAYVLKHAEKELVDLGRDLTELQQLKAPFMRMKYTEAIKKLGKKMGDDVTDAEERKLVEEIGRKPIFLTHFPRDMKAFYMRPDPKDPKTVLAADLLLPGVGETTGGSERIATEKELLESLKIFKLKKSDYEWYLDLRKYGSVQHSGYGLGIERLVMWITGAQHVFDTIPFPRTLDRVTP